MNLSAKGARKLLETPQTEKPQILNPKPYHQEFWWQEMVRMPPERRASDAKMRQLPVLPKPSPQQTRASRFRLGKSWFRLLGLGVKVERCRIYGGVLGSSRLSWRPCATYGHCNDEAKDTVLCNAWPLQPYAINSNPAEA